MESTICILGNPILHTPSVPVEHFDRGLRQEIERMKRLLEETGGVGLAAPQIGTLHRLFIMRENPEDEVSVIINPVIEDLSEEKNVAPEGCLSIPNVTVDVERAVSLQLHAQDEKGQELHIQAEGFRARIIQHETDHLDGVLIIDRCPREQRREALLGMVTS